MNLLDTTALHKLSFVVKDKIDNAIGKRVVTGIGIHVGVYECLSNLLNCPASGVLNPERNEDLPLCYPGWEGLLHVRTSDQIPYSIFKNLGDTGIHVSGGGSSIRNHPWDNVQQAIFYTTHNKRLYGNPTRKHLEVYSFAVRMYKDDFADIWKEFDQARMLQKLTSTIDHDNSRYRYTYTAPNEAVKDREHVAKYARLKTIQRI